MQSSPWKEHRCRNYVFENNGHLTFSDRSVQWGIDTKGFSHGAAYADLDNDGDLEVIVNNMNEEAQVYENRSNEIFDRNYLRVKFVGSPKNRRWDWGEGIGAKRSSTCNTMSIF